MLPSLANKPYDTGSYWSPAAVPVCGAIICGVGPPTPRTGPVSPAGAAVAPIGTPLPAALPMPGPPPCDTPL